MTEPESAESRDHPLLSEKLAAFEARLSAVEEKIHLGAGHNDPAVTEANSHLGSQATSPEGIIITADDHLSVDETTIESNILEYGLSWIGSIVLLFGIGFLMMFTEKYTNAWFSGLIGYASVAGVYLLSRYLKESHGHLSFLLNIGTHLLLYYVTFHLYFLTSAPVIPVREVVLVLLLLVCGFQIYRSLKLNSELMAFIALLLILITAAFCDLTHETLPLLTVSSVLSFWLFYHSGWWKQMIAVIVLVYFSHILWLTGNPLMGHSVSGVSSPQFNLIYLFSYGVLFSLVPLVKPGTRFTHNIYLKVILINGIFFFMVLFLEVLMFYMKNYSGIFLGIFAVCLAYSIFLKFRTTRIFDPAFYAILSFLSLSAAVYGFTGLPGAYFLLSLQSLLVVSWALWFRSQFIVVVNTILFTGMVAVYMFSGIYLDKVNFTLAFTAFLTARVINWQKMRLELKTEILRNVYLICLFFMFAFALYEAVPSHYVTPAWTGASIVYFILSLILKNTKYRWMAISMLLLTAVYLFVVDLAHMEVGYRVVAFLFLAVVLFGTSFYFTKFLRKKKTRTSGE